RPRLNLDARQRRAACVAARCHRPGPHRARHRDGNARRTRLDALSRRILSRRRSAEELHHDRGKLAPLAASEAQPPSLSVRDANPLVLLDSAGGTGWMEFTTLRQTMGDRAYVLLLDDVHHVKHYRSLEHVRRDPSFHIIGLDERHGWMLARHARPPT